VLFVYGLVSQEQVTAWLLLVSAIIPVLALVNVPGIKGLFRGSDDDAS
jgi:hypothetical protein